MKGRTFFTRTARGGRLLSALQLPWFALRPPAGYAVLTTVGRRTGKRRRACVRAIRRGDRAYLVAIKGRTGWLANIRANPAVSLRLREGTVRATAREIVDSGERGEARHVYCRSVNPLDRVAYRLWLPGRPTPERIRSLHEAWFAEGVPIAVDLRSNR